MERDFYFPLQPYDIQKDFMRELYNTITTKKFGIFQSPTGTGKTLSIICSSFTWLMENRQIFPSQNIHLQNPQQQQKFLDQIFQQNINTLFSNNRIRINPTQTREQDDFLISYQQKIKLRKKLNFINKQTPQILYISRTHIQLDQFTKEVKRTEWAEGPNRMKVIRIGSRKQLCVNQFLHPFKNTVMINYKCKELISPKNIGSDCYYYRNHELVESHALGQICDIEELVEYGKKIGGCPYFGTRYGLVNADIIVAPYASVLNKVKREAIGLFLENMVIIVDEAHNLLDSIIDNYSAEITHIHLQHSLVSVKAYYDKYSHMMKSRTLWYLDQILQILTHMNSFMKFHRERTKKSFSLSVSQFFSQNQLQGFWFQQIVDFVEQAELIRKISGFASRLNKNLNSNCLHFFIQLLSSISNDTTDSKFIFQYTQEKENGRLKYLFLNPTGPFREILQQSRCLILVGDTLEPQQEFKDLVSHLPADRITYFRCDHVIKRQQLLVVTVGQSSNGYKFKFTYDQRSNGQMMMELAIFILEITTVVPHGIVIFFPSFKFLQTFKLFLIKQKLLLTISQRKKVFFDNKSDSLFQQYVRAVNQRGAILFAVVRGRLSEGINFSDRLGRCVIFIGMPFMNKNDIEIKEKMQFLDISGSSYTGHMFYINSCHKAINQSIGRAIRHINDYACILLVDCRHQQTIQNRPSWMMPFVRTQIETSELKDIMREFYRNQIQGLFQST